LMLPGFALWIGATQFWEQRGMVIGGVMMGLYFLLLAVMSSAVQGIFNTALYRYACDQAVPPGFSRELIQAAWSPKD
jgi:hypothetical protein